MKIGIDQPSPMVIEPPINTAQRLLQACEDFRNSDTEYQKAADGMEKSLAFEKRRLAEGLLKTWTSKAEEELEVVIDTSIYEMIAHLMIFGKTEN